MPRWFFILDGGLRSLVRRKRHTSLWFFVLFAAPLGSEGPLCGPLTLAERMNEEKRGMGWRLRRNNFLLLYTARAVKGNAQFFRLARREFLLKQEWTLPSSTVSKKASNAAKRKK